MTKPQKYRRLNKEERKQIVQLWISGQAKMPELAQAYDVCTKTVRNTLAQAGVWPGVDDHTIKPDNYRASVIQREIDAAGDAVKTIIERNSMTSYGIRKTYPEVVALAIRLHQKGFTYEEIGRSLHCSRALVQNWLTYERVARANQAKEKKAEAKAEPIKMPEPQLVEAGTITMIRAPKRSLLERIKGFFN